MTAKRKRPTVHYTVITSHIVGVFGYGLWVKMRHHNVEARDPHGAAAIVQESVGKFNSILVLHGETSLPVKMMCPECGNEFTVGGLNRRPKFCGTRCRNRASKRKTKERKTDGDQVPAPAP